MEEWEDNSNRRKERQLIGVWVTLRHVMFRGVAYFGPEDIIQAGAKAGTIKIYSP